MVAMPHTSFASDVRIKVLVVGPDPRERERVCSMLGEQNCLAAEAEDFLLARELCGDFEPDLVMADLASDPEQGSAFLRQLKSRGDSAPPVVSIGRHYDYPELYPRFADYVPASLKRPVSALSLTNVLGFAAFSRKHRASVERLQSRSIEQGELLYSLVSNMPDSAVLLDGSGNIVAMNGPAQSEMTVPAMQLFGAAYLSVLPDAVGRAYSDALQRVFDGTPSITFRVRRGGATLEVFMRRVARGECLEGILVVSKDVTALMQSERELSENELRYRSVFEAGPDAILLVNRVTGDVLDSNRAARRLYGYSTDELEQLNFISDLSAESDRGVEVLAAEGGRMPIRKHRCRDGRVFPAETTMSPFSVGGQQVATVFVRDITSRKVVEEALREGARLYRAVVEDQTEFICRYKPSGSLTFVNRAYAKFFGRDEDSLIGSAFGPDIPDRETRRRLDRWMERVSPADPVYELEQQNVRHDGEIRWIRWVNRAIFDHRGNLSEFQAVGRDITHSRRAEEALKFANEEKERFRLNLEATFRSIPDAIITVDAHMRIIANNNAAYGICGLSDAASLGCALCDVVQSEPNPCTEVLEQVLRTRRPVRGFQAEMPLETGERMVELNCSPLLDEAGTFIGAVLVVRDISRIADLEKRLQERHGFRGIVGKSEKMQDIYRLLEQLASLEATVMICGESGTGKELAADALHYGGSRATGNMVKVNCSALSESLLESELFGHVKGAFTGAVRDKVGRIEAAEGGTLFLDEIADISPLIQLKLLRFLEQKEYERVGESSTRKADVRIIAATNVDLRERVEEGTFREDLFYRLNVMPVTLPPLREREGDVPLLVTHFIKIFSKSFDKKLLGVSEEVMDLFLRYTWPGNIRELKHLLEHACILCPGGTIGTKYLRPDVLEAMESRPASGARFIPTRPAAGVREIEEAIISAGGNKSRAAEILGIHRATLYRKMKQFGLEA
ncbi:sigma 54-interacting transcriptional regulator [Desulfovibrio oxyclinae]|uniref:sigma 54-interacting transcriptional regulator n=1 Tax=Desulfovibrio oxyclinae TaxID=63560 RepID=UPI0003A9F344|nr:sigma 54-interacting transcriptional regulator [Desulfovibrio oxyclinae]